MFRTNNPALKPDVFKPAQTWDQFVASGQGGSAAVPAARPNTMTLNGTLVASAVLLAITTAVAVAGWGMIARDPSVFFPIWGIGALGGFILALIISFNRKTAPILAPIYAMFEGAFVAGASIAWASYAANPSAAGRRGSGAISSLGTDIVAQAGLLTFAITAAMLLMYASRVIKPSARLLGGIVTATLGVVIFSFGAFLLSFFMPGFTTGLWSSPIGIGLAAVIVVLAAMNLILDFAVIENGVQNGAPKYMEWYGAFGLLVTLVWLYVSILRLLAILRRN